MYGTLPDEKSWNQGHWYAAQTPPKDKAGLYGPVDMADTFNEAHSQH